MYQGSDVLLALAGVPYAMECLRHNQSREPSLDDQKMFDYVLEHGDKATLITMVKYPLLWKDLDLFKRTVVASGGDKGIDVFGMKRLVEAYNIFSFGDLQTL